MKTQGLFSETVNFLKENFDRGEGVDAGGLKKDFLGKLAESLSEGREKTQSFRAEMDRALNSRRVLLFDILSNNFQRSSPAGASKITRRPETVAPQSLSNGWVPLFSY